MIVAPITFRHTRTALPLSAVLAVSATAAQAADFYQGKTVNIIVSYAAAYDATVKDPAFLADAKSRTSTSVPSGRRRSTSSSSRRRRRR